MHVRNVGVIAAAMLVVTAAVVAQNQQAMRRAWNRPQQPFQVFGNTYWVGTYSLGSVLVTSGMCANLVRRVDAERTK